jgi:predicted RNA methylase
MKIERNIIGVLEAAQIDGNKLVLTSQLDRSTYEAANKVLTAIGGKWSRKDKAHIFPEPAADVLDAVLLTGEYTRTKQNFGQFDTPEELARSVATRAMIQPGMLVLEPSAGLGRLIQATLDAGATAVHSVEIDPKRATGLRERFRSLRAEPCPARYQVLVNEADFLTLPASPIYDRVVMNPPFAKQADIDHIRHAFDFLLPGGRLVAIASSSVSFRSNQKATAFRSFVSENSGQIEALPDAAFKESGTNVSTVLVTIDKEK